MRRIARCARRAEEPWVDWLKRGTRSARRIAANASVRDWHQAHLELKWSWAGHVARQPTTSWVWKVTEWRDEDYSTLAREAGLDIKRPSRRRWMKWEDVLRRFCTYEGSGSWQRFAQNRETWKSSRMDFVTFSEKG